MTATETAPSQFGSSLKELVEISEKHGPDDPVFGIVGILIALLVEHRAAGDNGWSMERKTRVAGFLEWLYENQPQGPARAAQLYAKLTAHT